MNLELMIDPPHMWNPLYCKEIWWGASTMSIVCPPTIRPSKRGRLVSRVVGTAAQATIATSRIRRVGRFISRSSGCAFRRRSTVGMMISDWNGATFIRSADSDSEERKRRRWRRRPVRISQRESRLIANNKPRSEFSAELEEAAARRFATENRLSGE